MKIAFTVHKLPPESLGGTEVYTRSLARTLVGQGHQVAIFAPSTQVQQTTARMDDDGVLIHNVPLNPNQAQESAPALFWHTFRNHEFERAFQGFLTNWQPELVHFQHTQGVSAQLIALAQGLPRVATFHDYWYFCANSQLIRPDGKVCGGPSWGCMNCVDCATARADLHWLRTLRPLVAMPLAYRNRELAQLTAQLDLMISPSAFLRSQYIDQGFDPARLTVLENGMDMSRIEVSQGRPRREPSLPLRFGFLGALAWQKGVHVLIDAFNTLSPEIATLDIYGSDTAFPDYAASLRAAIRTPAVAIHPPAPYDQVGKVLRDFDVLIVPSLWYENSPLVIQEAFAAGVPVIASRLGALEEKVQPGVSGWHFASGDAGDLARVIHNLAADPAQITALRATLPTPPTMEAHARELVSRYKSLLP